MNIFVINSGSSSIKYQLISMPAATIICNGLVERIGLGNAIIIHKTFIENKEHVITKHEAIIDHAMGLQAVTQLLTDKHIGVITDPSQIDVVGHRVVHGGETFAATTIITPAVQEEIKKLFPLAPLHNPANYVGIEIAQKIFSSAMQIAVFDTAFNNTLPPKAYRYAIASNFYTTHGIRAYGFHGTSHKYVSAQAINYIGNPAISKIITIHLGNGCSIAAINNGKCVDTSMGLGPMNGLIMGTRCGDIDQSVIFYLVDQLGYDIETVNNILNKKSGMFGLTGFSDMRDIKKEIEKGNTEAMLAYEMYAYRIRKYIGAYIAVLNGIDAIVFTGGVGENDDLIRKMITDEFDYIGIQIDAKKNTVRTKKILEISTTNASVKILVIPTNEELEIAEQCYNLLTFSSTK